MLTWFLWHQPEHLLFQKVQNHVPTVPSAIYLHLTVAQQWVFLSGQTRNLSTHCMSSLHYCVCRCYAQSVSTVHCWLADAIAVLTWENLPLRGKHSLLSASTRFFECHLGAIRRVQNSKYGIRYNWKKYNFLQIQVSSPTLNKHTRTAYLRCPVSTQCSSIRLQWWRSE